MLPRNIQNNQTAEIEKKLEFEIWKSISQNVIFALDIIDAYIL